MYCHENHHLEKCHLANYHLASNLQLVSFLQLWVVRYDLITPSIDLHLRDFHQVRAHLARLTSDEVILKVFVVNASSFITLRILSS